MNFKLGLLGIIASIVLSSCSVALPSFSKTSTGVTVTNNVAQVEALSKDDYTVLRTTSGKASTVRCYILFIPIGKHKTNVELYENAYYNAVDNLPNADALLLPRQKTKRLTIPLILFNYSKRTTTVSGVGISIDNKVLENNESEIPYDIANNYSLNPNSKVNRLKGLKITSQQEFDKYFVAGTDASPIDFSKQYAIAVIGKESKKSAIYNVNYLKLKGSGLEVSYDLEEGEKRERSEKPNLIILVDKKYQGDIISK